MRKYRKQHKIVVKFINEVSTVHINSKTVKAVKITGRRVTVIQPEESKFTIPSISEKTNIDQKKKVFV